MAITVKFSKQVRDWIVHNLGRGVAAQDILAELIAHKTEPELAAAMVGAVAHALKHGMPLPDGHLVLDAAVDHAASGHDLYRPDAMRLPAGPLIRIADRDVFVLARMARPSTAILANVLSVGECDRLIAAARPRLKPSLVVDPITGLDVAKDHRSSLGMFFRPSETPLIGKIERRIAELIDRPIENGEGLQILHYPTGAESTPHFDYLMPANEANRLSVARSGQRVCTLIMYLNDVPAGGETTFPESGWSVVPRKGHAVYFEYGNAAGQTDPASLHAGAPVLSGEKWIATKWVRSRKFVGVSPAGHAQTGMRFADARAPSSLSGEHDD
jgi:prolyl 4-hydroxylase